MSRDNQDTPSFWLFLLPLVWLGGYVLLARYGVFLLPRFLAQQLTLTSYLGLVQLLISAIGLFCVLRLTRTATELRSTLLPVRIRAASLVYALLLAPSVYVLAHSVGMYLAFDTLIAELAAKGARAVQQQTGEFGRSTALDSWLVVIPFTVFVAPIGEELLFRGGFYGTIQSFFPGNKRSRAAESESEEVEPIPDSIVIAGLPRRRAPQGDLFKRTLSNGGAAWLFSSLAFGLMHADTPGGMGIVRVTSASVLGLACGYARLKGASLVPPIALHAGYNLLALGTLRAWFVSESWPSKYALPTLLLPVAGLTLFAAALLLLIEKRIQRNSSSVS